MPNFVEVVTSVTKGVNFILQNNSLVSPGKHREKGKKKNANGREPKSLEDWNCPKMPYSTCIAVCNQPVLSSKKPKGIYRFHHHFSKQLLQLVFTAWMFPWRPQPHHFQQFTKESLEGSFQPPHREPYRRAAEPTPRLFDESWNKRGMWKTEKYASVIPVF